MFHFELIFIGYEVIVEHNFFYIDFHLFKQYVLKLRSPLDFEILRKNKLDYSLLHLPMYNVFQY